MIQPKWYRLQRMFLKRAFNFKGGNMKKIMIYLLPSLLLIGCGGGSSSSSGGGSTPPPSSNVDMVISQSYSVYPGNIILKDSDAAQVSIVHIEGHSESTVKLLSGSATIIR